LEVLSVNDTSSGISPKRITQESQHATQDNSRGVKVERWANITESRSPLIETCTPVSQCVQGIFHSAPGTCTQALGAAHHLPKDVVWVYRRLVKRTLRSAFEGCASESETRGNSSGCTYQARRAACLMGKHTLWREALEMAGSDSAPNSPTSGEFLGRT
jgi:hypothetical protein